MNTLAKAGALLLGAALAAGVAGCKNRTDDTAAPVTTPDTTTPAPPPDAPPETAPVSPATPPADSTTPPPDTTTPPATGTTPSSGTSGTQGTQGSGLPSSTAPDKVDHKDPQRDRRPGY